jgi:formylglycine-generating enzyme required for sulfatase activity/tRNA A-37 threonylcarbamoyl transferase component Bud32
MDDPFSRDPLRGPGSSGNPLPENTAKANPPPMGVGSVVKDRYEIVRELGRGGFGRVFLAHDRQMHDRPVVVKIKLDQAVDDPWFERKFSEELRALTLIDHPGVVGVLDNGRTVDGKPFLVMQYIEGMTLRSVLTPEGMPLDLVASIVRQIGQALGAAHDKNIWHRDLKPENIMLQPVPGGDQRVRLIDFGLATIADAEKRDTRTRVAGSLAYMAPEQATGQPTAATDIYTFGLIAYEMATGRKPFVPEDVDHLSELQRAGVRVKPSALRPGISASAERLILQSLNYNPNDRPPDARAFGDQLSQALLAVVESSRKSSRMSKVAIVRRDRRWAWTAAGVIAAILAVGGVWFYRNRIAPVTTEVAKPPAAVVANPGNVQKADAGASESEVEVAFWNSISASSDPRMYREYLAEYPRGKFAALAKLKLESTPAKLANTTPAKEPAAPLVQTQVNRVDGLPYAWIPPGSFRMGCSPGDEECGADELPVHTVRLSHGFWLGETAVTAGAWSRFSKQTHRDMPSEPKMGNLALNPGWSRPRLPMVLITWAESKAYCAWAGGRLLTEAEWEYAERAGSKEARYGPLDEIAWNVDNSGKERVDFRGIREDAELFQRAGQNGNRMHPVGTKQPNAFGLYDMLGNVGAWLNDWWSDTYYKQSPELDPPGPESGMYRSTRGGNFFRPTKGLRASARVGVTPNSRVLGVGCRCALDVVPASAASVPSSAPNVSRSAPK